MPLFAFAQYLDKTEHFFDSAYTILTDILIPLVFTLALFLFFWGVAKYIWSEGAGKEEGKKIMIWGVIALFVMSSVWGLVRFIRGELNIDGGTEGVIPTIK